MKRVRRPPRDPVLFGRVEPARSHAAFETSLVSAPSATKRSSRQPQTRVNGARAIARNTLVRVLDQRQALDTAFDAELSQLSAMSDADRRFARMLATTCLRRLGHIDHAIGQFLQKPMPAKAKHARAILRLGAAQLLFLDTPAHAAVDTAARLAQSDNATRPFKGLINAVLRRISDAGPSIIADQTPESNWPDWLIASWRDTYGHDQSALIASASATEPPLDLTIKSGDVAAWAKRLGGRAISATTVRLTEMRRVQDLEGYEDGDWWVQDLAAATPVTVLGNVSGLRVLDLCAAPGGKTMQLAARGADVVAIDRSADRLRRLHENLKRTKLTAEIMVRDGRNIDDLGKFDAIVLDAPCTATGTLRRRPDVAWSRSPGDGGALSEIQSELVASALGALKPGGTLIYCTCSLQPEEGRNAVDSALMSGADGQFLPIRDEELPAGFVSPQDDGTVRTFPFALGGDGGMDGFFIARLVKTG